MSAKMEPSSLEPATHHFSKFTNPILLTKTFTLCMVIDIIPISPGLLVQEALF